jgi:hypothetical protein
MGAWDGNHNASATASFSWRVISAAGRFFPSPAVGRWSTSNVFRCAYLSISLHWLIDQVPCWSVSTMILFTCRIKPLYFLQRSGLQLWWSFHT